MAWELKKVEDQRKQLVDAYFAGEIAMKELCNRFGISRKTAYKWLKRYLLYGVEGLKDQSKAPHFPHRIYGEQEIELALGLKLKHRKWGPKKIHHKLKERHLSNEFPSPTRLYEIFKDHHLVTARRLKARVPATHPLGNVGASNDTWMADFKGWFLTQNKEKCEPFTITDGFSRFLLRCTHVNNKSVETVWEIIKGAFYEYGIPKRFRTDNGPPFATTGVARLSQLSINLIKAGVLPEWITPGHPEENGQHERMHGTLQESVADPAAETLKEQINRLHQFQREFNFERPHEALQMQTPASVYRIPTRTWDGKLQSPEYDGASFSVRKVGSSGCIRIMSIDYFVGQVLAKEYVGLKEHEQGFEAYYGSVYLGLLKIGEGFVTPVQRIRRKRN
jgi:putative transposase